MPRANRHHLPHCVWHITHRCHRRQFLLRFARDRQIWMRWLYAADRRYGLCVLDYAVTSNHIHLLVRDQGRGEIACSLQLVAGRTAQAYNVPELAQKRMRNTCRGARAGETPAPGVWPFRSDGLVVGSPDDESSG